MPSISLTDAKLATLKPPAAGTIEISDSVVPGLRVRLGVSGGRTFIVRSRVAISVAPRSRRGDAVTPTPRHNVPAPPPLR